MGFNSGFKGLTKTKSVENNLLSALTMHVVK